MNPLIKFNELSEFEQKLIIDRFEFIDALFFINVRWNQSYHLSAFHESSMLTIPLYEKKCFDGFPGLDFDDLFGSGLVSYVNTSEQEKVQLYDPIPLEKPDAIRLISNKPPELKLSLLFIKSIKGFDYSLKFDQEISITRKSILFDYDRYNLSFAKKFQVNLAELKNDEFRESIIRKLSKQNEYHPLQFALVNFLNENGRLPKNRKEDKSALILLMKTKFESSTVKNNIEYDDTRFLLTHSEVWKYLDQTHLARAIDYLMNRLE
jgi:hypothetical protein